MNLPFTARAQLDLIDIWYAIARDNPSAADGVLDDIREHARFLRDHPTAGDIVRRSPPRLRTSAVGSYVLYYRFEQRRIAIICVLHGARDFRSPINE